MKAIYKQQEMIKNTSTMLATHPATDTAKESLTQYRWCFQNW